MNEEEMIICTRCGSKMKASSRYCMKCGNLNEGHPDNDKYSKIITKSKKESNYELGSGKKIYNNSDKTGMTFISEKNKNRNVFIIFNIIVIAILCLVALIPLLSLDIYNIDSILNSGVLTGLFVVGLFSICFVSNQILYIKLDEYWWSSFIPFYNNYLLARAIFNNGWLFLLMFIPVVNIIYSIIINYKLGESFGKNGVLTVLFLPIMLPIIAFGSSAFNNVYYVTDNSSKSLENTYGSYKKFAEFSLFLVLLGFIGFIFTNDTFKSLVGYGDEKEFVVSRGETVINKVQEAVDSGNVSCVNSNGEDTNISLDGVYYFYSEDFLYDFGVKSLVMGNSEGYVKVVNSSGDYNYYIAYSTDDYGIKETSLEELSVDKVEGSISIDKPIGNMCSID